MSLVKGWGNMEIVYKVVRVLDGRMISTAAFGLFGIDAVAEYTVGKITRPPIPESRLFVFRELHFAQIEYAKVFGPAALLKCESRGLIRLTDKELPYPRNIKSAWDRGKIVVGFGDGRLYTPEGTCVVKAVKPIEILESRG